MVYAGADSTPGLTGTTQNFFLWLLTVIPKIFVEGYNDYISNHIGLVTLLFTG